MTREEIIKDLRYIKNMNRNSLWQGRAIDEAIKSLENQRMGHWIEHPHEAGQNWEYSMYECSECHDWSEDDSDYCPDCGAFMKGE